MKEHIERVEATEILVKLRLVVSQQPEGFYCSASTKNTWQWQVEQQLSVYFVVHTSLLINILPLLLILVTLLMLW